MMTPEQSAALERLIAAAKAHPLALTIPEASKATVEADVRRIVREGLTAKEARHLAAALDTPDERGQVHALLAAVASEQDARIVLQWLLADVLRALATGDTPAGQSHAGGAVAPHATTFLRSNARLTSHVLLSEALTDAKRAELIAYNKAQQILL